MKKGYIYTIIFMLLIAFVFSAILATTNAISKDKIKNNEALLEKAAILSAMNIEFTQDEIIKLSENIVRGNNNEFIYYQLEYGTVIEKYAIYFEGAGLWGTITGYIGVSNDLTTMLGIDFTYQNETPGLGGRIEEKWYKDQFKNLLILNFPIEYGEGIDAITGATSTSNAVIKMINETINSKVSKLGGIQ